MNIARYVELCFKGTQEVWNKLPSETFHFARGVDVKLKKEVTFVYSSGAFCLAFDRSHDISVFGSEQMADLNIGYTSRLFSFH